MRAKQGNIDEACRLLKEFLKWRSANNVDAIRQDIVYGGKNSPFLFPHGQYLIEKAPQIIISPTACDREGRPILMESYDFDAKELLKNVGIADYIQFFTYVLEFRALVIEQMSADREREYLEKTPTADRKDGWGVCLLTCSIRDLRGRRITVCFYAIAVACSIHILSRQPLLATAC